MTTVLQYLSVFLFCSIIANPEKDNKQGSKKEVAVKAWNEKKSPSYQFTLFTDQTFSYTITTDSLAKKLYTGSCSIKKDTVFLQYKGSCPPKANRFLTVEITGLWLIQGFSDTTSRQFMRIQQGMPGL